MGAGHSSLKNDVVRSESAELYVIRTSLHSSLGAVLLEAVHYRTPQPRSRWLPYCNVWLQ